MALSQKAYQFSKKILSHYPNNSEEKQNVEHVSKHQQPPSNHLHDYRKERQIYERPTSEKIQNIEFFKLQGNKHYKYERYSQAAYFYQKAVVYGDYTFPEQPADQARLKQLLQQANCNLALCLIKMENWEKAKMYLNESLKGTNISITAKALYWLARYYIRFEDITKFDETLAKFQKLGQKYKQECISLKKQLQTFERNKKIELKAGFLTKQELKQQ